MNVAVVVGGGAVNLNETNWVTLYTRMIMKLLNEIMQAYE